MFLVSITAWRHFAIRYDARTASQFILEVVFMGVDLTTTMETTHSCQHSRKCNRNPPKTSCIILCIISSSPINKLAANSLKQQTPPCPTIYDPHNIRRRPSLLHHTSRLADMVSHSDLYDGHHHFPFATTSRGLRQKKPKMITVSLGFFADSLGFL